MKCLNPPKGALDCIPKENENNNIITWVITGVLSGLYSIFLGFYFFFSQLIDNVSSMMTDKDLEAKYFQRLLRVLSFLAEITVIVTSFVTVVLVTDQQKTTLLNILVNLAGVQVVSTLDEVLINFLDPGEPFKID